MTPDALRAALEADGWRIGQQTRDTGVPWYAWRKLGGAVDCSCNHKPPSLILNPFEIMVHGNTWRSVEFEVCGEAGRRWLRLVAYSVPIDEALQAIPQCEDLLLAAWNAAVQAAGVQP